MVNQYVYEVVSGRNVLIIRCITMKTLRFCLMQRKRINKCLMLMFTV